MKTPTPCLFALLLLPLALRTGAQTPTQVVQEYLDARAAGRYDAAYALLSPATRTLLAYSRFSSADYRPQALFPVVDDRLRSEQSRKRLAEMFAPARAFFLDSHNTQGVTFVVGGQDPARSDVVFVRAVTKGQKVEDAARLPVVIIQGDGADTKAPRIDFGGTVHAVALDWREQARQALSRTNLRIIGLSILQYAMDHDQDLPDADRWMEELLPYVKSEAAFHDPSAPAPQWGYAFNRNLSHRNIDTVDAPDATAIVFESTQNVRNAADAGESFAHPGRHRCGSNFVSVEGHVKWLLDGTVPRFTFRRAVPKPPARDVPLKEPSARS